jgi:glycosidase
MQRFMSEKGATVEGLKLAQTFLMTTRGTPLLYYGDELAMPGGGDPDNRRDFPGGFPNDERNAFTKAGRTTAENDVFEHLKRLAKLRAEHAALRRGALINLYDEEQQTAYARVLGTDRVLVAINNDAKPATIEFDGREAARLLGGGEFEFDDVLRPAADMRMEQGRVRMTLAPRSAAVMTGRAKR